MIRALLILAIASTSVHADEAITFKGFTLGVAPKADVTAAFPQADNGQYGCPKICYWQQPAAACFRHISGDADQKKCLEFITYGGVVPTQLRMTFDEDKLANVDVYFQSFKFDELVATIKERFGEPNRVDKTVVQTRMGVSVPSKAAAWVRGETVMSVLQHGSRIDEGIVTITTTRYMEKKRAEHDESVKSSAKGL